YRTINRSTAAVPMLYGCSVFAAAPRSTSYTSPSGHTGRIPERRLTAQANAVLPDDPARSDLFSASTGDASTGYACKLVSRPLLARHHAVLGRRTLDRTPARTSSRRVCNRRQQRHGGWRI